MSAIFDNILFQGPFDIDYDGIPSTPGVYLICTVSAGGKKIIGVYESEDIRSSVASNNKRPCWEKNRGDSPLELYYLCDDSSNRGRIQRKIIQNRWYGIECNDPIIDDF